VAKYNPSFVKSTTSPTSSFSANRASSGRTCRGRETTSRCRRRASWPGLRADLLGGRRPDQLPRLMRIVKVELICASVYRGERVLSHRAARGRRHVRKVAFCYLWNRVRQAEECEHGSDSKHQINHHEEPPGVLGFELECARSIPIDSAFVSSSLHGTKTQTQNRACSSQGTSVALGRCFEEDFFRFVLVRLLWHGLHSRCGFRAPADPLRTNERRLMGAVLTGSTTVKTSLTEEALGG